MASHVVVIESTARRHTVKTTPAKYLSEVLQEACVKFGLDPDHHGLKHNNKLLDLSRTLRLSGLSSGAKINLTQVSRSPSVVSVALQVSSSSNGFRLTDKFPSDTSLWQILRRFESGAAGGDATSHKNLNFTQRGVAMLAPGDTSGAGRLYYELPLINIMGRDINSLSDLQKSLKQLGITSGSVLMRLSFRQTQQPLEEAMFEISKHFRTEEQAVSALGTATGKPDLTPTADPIYPASDHTEQVSESIAPGRSSDMLDPSTDQSDPGAYASSPDINASQVQNEDVAIDPSISIFAPPSNDTPVAARAITMNEADYVPTIDHAKRHQALLIKESRNRKLLSDSEIAQLEQERSERLSSVTFVTVRFRFPDQSQAQRTFGKEATCEDLYKTCRELMNRPGNEEFSIRATGEKGVVKAINENSTYLIKDLGWHSRILVLITWAAEVSDETKQRPSLKPEYRRQAESLKVDEVDQGAAGGDGPANGTKATEADPRQDTKSGGSADKEAKMKKFLGKLIKK